jgi:hypothetical protein
MIRLLLSLSAILVLAAGVARAGPVHEFHGELADATRHYREASFYLRTGNLSVAAYELAQLRDKWQALTARFQGAPPDLYSTDPEWKATLVEIEARIGRGLAATEADDAAAAKGHLAPIRAILGQLRRRNGVFLFADCVDQANAAFERLFRFRHAPPDFDKTDEVDALRRALAVTSHWYRRCRDEAPAAYAREPQFERLMRGSLDSLSRIWAAIESKSARRLISILRELGSSDRLLYLRFG